MRSTDAAPKFEMDPLALFREVASPFAFFGIKPTMFDAPFRDEKYDLTWRAETFLCAIPDGVMSQHAQPLAGFGWGFDVLDRGIALVAPTVLDLSAWDQHLSVLRSLYPTWVFDDVAGRSRPAAPDMTSLLANLGAVVPRMAASRPPTDPVAGRMSYLCRVWKLRYEARAKI